MIIYFEDNNLDLDFYHVPIYIHTAIISRHTFNNKAEVCVHMYVPTVYIPVYGHYNLSTFIRLIDIHCALLYICVLRVLDKSIIRECNNSQYRYLFPDRFWKEMASMRQRLVTLSNTTVGLLDMGKVGFTFTFTFISSQEQLLKYWWDEVRRLPEVVKIHILYYLAPMNFVQMLLSYVA